MTAVEAGSRGAGTPATVERPPVPILMYHQVAPVQVESFAKYIVTPRAFAAQMRWLSLRGYEAVGMDALVESRAGRRPLPRRPIVITFDDGFQGCADHAMPILESFGFMAIVYVVAGLIGEPSRWLVRERGLEFPLMGWETIGRLRASGHEIGAHTVTHPRLAELPADERVEELVRSKAILEEGLGEPVDHLAYPFGSYDDAVRASAIEAGYRSACSVRIGVSGPEDDLFALHRVPVSGTDSLIDFIARLRNGWNAGDQMRSLKARALSRVRRAGRAGVAAGGAELDARWAGAEAGLTGTRAGPTSAGSGGGGSESRRDDPRSGGAGAGPNGTEAWAARTDPEAERAGAGPDRAEAEPGRAAPEAGGAGAGPDRAEAEAGGADTGSAGPPPRASGEAAMARSSADEDPTP
jgi:peptidoglycan/xylan/chitin deacetylase (PgdA/CDA1 family)